MNEFYHSYYKIGKGITEKDFRKEINKASKVDLDNLWDNYLYGAKNFYSLLKSTLKKSDFKLTKKHNEKYFAAHYGFFNQPGTNKALLIAPKSPAFKAGINVGDKVISINNIFVKNDEVNEWVKYFGNDIKITLLKNNIVSKINLSHTSKTFFDKFTLSKNE